MTKKSTITLEINSLPLQKLYGKEIQIEVDGSGEPLLREWRNRVKDARIDGCVKVKGKKVAELPSALEVNSDSDRAQTKEKRQHGISRNRN